MILHCMAVTILVGCMHIDCEGCHIIHLVKALCWQWLMVKLTPPHLAPPHDGTRYIIGHQFKNAIKGRLVPLFILILELRFYVTGCSSVILQAKCFVSHHHLYGVGIRHFARSEVCDHTLNWICQGNACKFHRKARKSIWRGPSSDIGAFRRDGMNDQCIASGMLPNMSPTSLTTHCKRQACLN
jgi:hypothetical protein